MKKNSFLLFACIVFATAAQTLIVAGPDVGRVPQSGVGHVGMLMDLEHGKKSCTATIIKRGEGVLIGLTAAHCFLAAGKTLSDTAKEKFQLKLLKGLPLEDIILEELFGDGDKLAFNYNTGATGSTIRKIIFHPAYISSIAKKLKRRLPPELFLPIPHRSALLGELEKLWKNESIINAAFGYARKETPRAEKRYLQALSVQFASNPKIWTSFIDELSDEAWVNLHGFIEKRLRNMERRRLLTTEQAQYLARIFIPFTFFRFSDQFQEWIDINGPLAYDLALFECDKTRLAMGGPMMNLSVNDGCETPLIGLHGVAFDDQERQITYQPPENFYRASEEGIPGFLKCTSDFAQFRKGQRITVPIYGDSGSPLFQTLADGSVELVAVNTFIQWPTATGTDDYLSFSQANMASWYRPSMKAIHGYIDLRAQGQFIEHYLNFAY